EFVRRRHWLSEERYSDLVALCQFLPGPASSQVVFALGMHRGGLAGAFVASLCFTLPSAVLMIAFAYGVATIGGRLDAEGLHGLKLAAVAVVPQAVWGLGSRVCQDARCVVRAPAAAPALVSGPGAEPQVAVIAAGAVLGWLMSRTEGTTGSTPAA